MLKTTTSVEFHIKVHLLGNTGELRRHRKTTRSQNVRKLKSRERSLQSRVYLCSRDVYTLKRGNKTLRITCDNHLGLEHTLQRPQTTPYTLGWKSKCYIQLESELEIKQPPDVLQTNFQETG